jgi:hypothetical protein
MGVEADRCVHMIRRMATSESLLVGVAENVRTEVACQLDRTRGVWERRDRVDGRAARRHRAIDAILRGELVVVGGESVNQ